MALVLPTAAAAGVAAEAGRELGSLTAHHWAVANSESVWQSIAEAKRKTEFLEIFRSFSWPTPTDSSEIDARYLTATGPPSHAVRLESDR